MCTNWQTDNFLQHAQKMRLTVQLKVKLDVTLVIIANTRKDTTHYDAEYSRHGIENFHKCTHA